MLYEAGLPPEMLSIVTGNPRTMGDAMITDPRADVVTFTGSVTVGKYIADKAGYKRLVLELGGNDPLIVMDDLSTPISTRRPNWPCRRDQEFRPALHGREAHPRRRAGRRRVRRTGARQGEEAECGDPMDPETDVGTVIHEGAAKSFEARVNDAVAKGAKLLHGDDRQGALFPVTVVDHVPYDCELVHEETFGPVVPMIRVPADIDEIIRISNSTAFGLSSGVCTNRLDYHHAVHQRSRRRHRECLGGARLSHRDEPVRRHQGYRPRLQGRRVGGDEELFQRQDLLAALAG